jgi:hypothetical protein
MELLTQKTRKRIFFQKSVFTVLLALVTIFSCEVEEPIPTYTLTTSVTPSEGGKISVSPQEPNYLEGSQVTLTPEPNENWVFKQWEGDASGSTTPLQLTMTANKNVVGVFVKRDYPLTIKIEGEGTVEEKIIPNPSGREYPHGTTVELTPKPKDGWEFESWSGDLTGNESPKRITVDNQKNVTAKFKEAVMFYTKQTIVINSTKFSTKAVEGMMANVSASFVYRDSKGDVFSFHPGFAIEGDFSSLETVPAVTSQILKKENGVWVRFKEDDKALFWGARNFKIIGDKVVVSDANEIGPNPFPSIDQQWRGNILYGKIMTGGNIDWVTVNKPEEMGFFHGVSMGDLNKDGLLDIGGTPGRLRPDTGYDLDIFYQESVNQFKFVDNSIPSDGRTFNVPFTLEFEDLFGDTRAEIITADYGGSPIPGPNDNEIRIFSFDEQTSKYVQKFKGNNSSAYTSGLGATSIKAFDVNKDGIKDITVAREGGNESGQILHGFEVWLGKPNGSFEFSFSSPTWTEREMQFREFQILDANNDGLDDIILIPFHYGSLFRNNGPCGPGTCKGIKLNHLIWLSKGDGTFSNYNKTPLVLPDVDVYHLLPYKVGNFLHFVGTQALGTYPNFSSNYNLFDIRIKID